jgi:hypothetical protein
MTGAEKRTSLYQLPNFKNVRESESSYLLSEICTPKVYFLIKSGTDKAVS